MARRNLLGMHSTDGNDPLTGEEQAAETRVLRGFDPTPVEPPADWSPPEGLEAAVQIDRLNLQGEMMRVPQDLAVWGSRYGDAIQDAELAESNRKLVDAELEVEYRERYSVEEKKATEKAIAAEVMRDPRMVEARHAEAKAIGEKWRARAFFAAIQAKKDMLMLLGSAERDERRSTDGW